MSSMFAFVGGPRIQLDVGSEQKELFRMEARRDFINDRTERRKRLGPYHALAAMRDSVSLILTNPRVNPLTAKGISDCCKNFIDYQESHGDEEVKIMAYQIGELHMDSIRLFLHSSRPGRIEIYLKAFDYLCEMSREEMLSGASPYTLGLIAMGRAREYFEKHIQPLNPQ